MSASGLSGEAETRSLLGKRVASPPMAMRSSKSAISEVRDTLVSFIKRSRLDSLKDQIEDGDRIEASFSGSEKQRTVEAFTDRVRSFTVTNWMGKPLCLSPPLLAQYGWQCIGVDTVKCCSCSAVLCVRLPWPSEGNYRLECYKFRHKLLTKHMKICSWPSYPCSDSFVSPFLHGAQGMSEICEEFCGRRDRLISSDVKLPQIDQEVLGNMNLHRKELQTIENAFPVATTVGIRNEQVVSSGLSPSEICTVLAVCGWDTADPKCRSLVCESTGRVIQLHNFFLAEEKIQPEAISQSENSASGDAGSTSPLKIKKQCFHPLQQHPPWSHWVATLKSISKDEFTEPDVDQVTADNDELFQCVVCPLVKNAQPGWRVVSNVLLGRKVTNEKSSPNPAEKENETSGDNDTPKQSEDGGKATHDVQKSPPKSVMAHVRKLLNEWSSPR